jgi:ribosome assembly protein YihI (activator of Der GTPase)
VLARYAGDFVAICRTESAVKEALRRIGLMMNRLGLKTASEEDADDGLETWKEKLCVSGLHDSKKAKHTAEP